MSLVSAGSCPHLSPNFISPLLPSVGPVNSVENKALATWLPACLPSDGCANLTSQSTLSKYSGRMSQIRAWKYLVLCKTVVTYRINILHRRLTILNTIFFGGISQNRSLFFQLSATVTANVCGHVCRTRLHFHFEGCGLSKVIM